MVTSADLARETVESVVDPELPMLTLAELGVLRSIDVEDDLVTVSITPTYSGCPAVAEMRADLTRVLHEAGFRAEVRLSLSPPWSTDDLSDEGRAKLAAAGLAPPGPRPDGPVLLRLSPTPVQCVRCGSIDTEETSRFGPTACLSLWRCRTCREPFEHMKAI